MTAILNSTGGIYDKVRAKTEVIGQSKAEKHPSYNMRSRILIYDSMPEAAQDFGNVSLISAFSNAARAGAGLIEPHICVNPTIELSDEIKSRRETANYYISEEEAVENNYEIIIFNGWARTRGKDLELEEAYQRVSSFLKTQKDRTPLMIGLCAGAEAIAFDEYGVIATPFSGGKKHGYYDYTAEDKADELLRYLSDRIIMPASRNMDISRGIEKHKDLKSLFSNSDANIGIATSKDRHFHFILTHPEYVAKSIAMEQIRDWKKYAAGELTEEPTNAYGVLQEVKDKKFAKFKEHCRDVREQGLKTIPTFKIEEVEDELYNYWHSTLTALSAYYLGKVNNIKIDMMMGGKAPAYAPNYKPVTESGIVAPA